VSSPTNKVATSLKTVQSDIKRMAEKHGRDPAEITLLAVSKTKPLALIEQAIEAGQMRVALYRLNSVEKSGEYCGAF